jgi:hypothetical protein
MNPFLKFLTVVFGILSFIHIAYAFTICIYTLNMLSSSHPDTIQINEWVSWTALPAFLMGGFFGMCTAELSDANCN